MPTYRRKQLKLIAVLAFAIVSFLYILHHIHFLTTSVAVSVDPADVVIVTLLDRRRLSEGYVKKIVANREHYAKHHGKN